MVMLIPPSAHHQGFSQERPTPLVHIQTHFVDWNLIHTPRIHTEAVLWVQNTEHYIVPAEEPGNSCDITWPPRGQL